MARAKPKSAAVPRAARIRPGRWGPRVPAPPGSRSRPAPQPPRRRRRPPQNQQRAKLQSAPSSSPGRLALFDPANVVPIPVPLAVGKGVVLPFVYRRDVTVHPNYSFVFLAGATRALYSTTDELYSLVEFWKDSGAGGWQVPVYQTYPMTLTGLTAIRPIKASLQIDQRTKPLDRQGICYLANLDSRPLFDVSAGSTSTFDALSGAIVSDPRARSFSLEHMRTRVLAFPTDSGSYDAFTYVDHTTTGATMAQGLVFDPSAELPSSGMSPLALVIPAPGVAQTITITTRFLAYCRFAPGTPLHLAMSDVPTAPIARLNSMRRVAEASYAHQV